MRATHDIYLEVGTKRVFAGALDWPGWCRSGRDENAAVQALAEHGPRYAKALGRAARGFAAPADTSSLRVVERLEGNATTDFGAPGIAPRSDDRPLEGAELGRQAGLLGACWAALDAAAVAATDVELRKGPRGGGRELDAIVRHVLDADSAYLAKLGGRYRKLDATTDVPAEMADVRASITELLGSLSLGEPPPRTPRSGSLWAPRYCVRRSAWHALDHAWEIEDRATP